MKAIVRISAFGYLAGIFISHPLWGYGERMLPSFAVDRFVVSDASFLTNLSPLSPVLSFLLVAALTVLLWCPELRRAQLLLVLASALLVATDVHRLQPWVYQYVITISLVLLAGQRKEQFYNAMLLLLAGTYFYSGAQKLNPIFLLETFPFLLRPISPYLEMSPALMAIGAMIPFIEMALGLALLFPRLQKMAAVGVIAMHSAILLNLGPLGQNHNAVVWPWNVCMILLVAWLVFAQKVKWQGSYLQTACVRLAAAVFVVLPTLSFFGWWPSYLSMSLYSGNTTRAGVIFDSSSAPQFAAPLERVVLQRSDTQREIALVDWSFSILRVPPFPEHAALRDAAQQLCRQYHLENANVEISHRLLLFGSNARVEKVRCIE